MKRRLELDGIGNLRDLGGHPTRCGRLTRWKAFLRADHLQTWSPASQQALIDYGVSLVVDLRTPQETSSLPNGFAGSTRVQYRNIPLLTPEQAAGERYRAMDRQRADNAELYEFILDECREQVRDVLTAMSENDRGTTVFHCYAGKDRTGVVAALLLSLVEAHHDAIVEDYALTAECMREPFAALCASAVAAGADAGRLAIAFASLPQSMLRLLRHLHERHGGVESYMSACGVAGGDIARLRDRLLS